MWFVIGDHLAGAAMGVATAAAVRLLVPPGMDMVIAMMIGMAAGMALHIVLGFAFGPLLGMFQSMMPASLIGMYGGMAFGMRDSMGAGSNDWWSCLAVGAAFGMAVAFGVHLYNRALRATVVEGVE